MRFCRSFLMQTVTLWMFKTISWNLVYRKVALILVRLYFRDKNFICFSLRDLWHLYVILYDQYRSLLSFVSGHNLNLRGGVQGVVFNVDLLEVFLIKVAELLDEAVPIILWGEMTALIVISMAALLLRHPVGVALLFTSVLRSTGVLLTWVRFSLTVAFGVSLFVEALTSPGADIDFILRPAVGYFWDAKLIYELSLAKFYYECSEVTYLEITR